MILLDLLPINKMIHLHGLFYVVCSCVSAVYTQTSCLNPDFIVGECVRIEQCPSLYALVYIRRKTPQQAALLRQSKCGFDEDRQDSTVHQKVCCTDEPATKGSSSKGSGSRQDCGRAAGPGSSTRKIADLGAHPWLALIEYTKKSIGSIEPGCTGTILSSKMVITAAQCLDYSKLLELGLGPPTRVRVGEHDLSSLKDCGPESCNAPPKYIKIFKFFIPKIYSSDGAFAYNDIGIVKLAEDIEFSDSVKAICLPERSVVNNLRGGTALYTAGWGVYVDEVKSSEKREVQIELVDRSTCEQQYEYIDVSLIVDETTICAGNVCEDQKYQNMGSPLMMYQQGTWYLIGISTLILNYCGAEQFSGLFTKVYSYDNWIKAQLQSHPKI